MTAEDYLREASLAMGDAYTENCVRHACAVAELLLAEGRAPWIGRLREVIPRGDTTFHPPLIPKRFPGTTWNTHYVCCSGEEAFDPMAGEPVPVAEYSERVFGREIAVQEFLDAPTTEQFLRDGKLKQAFHPRLPSVP
ncbi:MAG TPA: hypothetical protein VEK57_15075 [Thermoanaerobaculia bacterium]|nr:hypothetical protein [Thermoanaerobaculia bacterium]